MWPYYPELLEAPVPRYTSYPTAADFGALPFDALRQAIERSSGDISLYLHIPFCEAICHYCGCNTGRANRQQRVASYLDALHSEIATIGALLPSDAKVRRIAFGGGSPNAIAPRDFLKLAEALDSHLPLTSPDWSIELDPRSMTKSWGEAIGAVGITRASMGVQTFAPHCQKAIGRVQDDATICNSLDWLRAAGVTSLNFDLMYGLPGQSFEDLDDSLAQTAKLGAERVAVFGYAHVPHIVPRQKAIAQDSLPGGEARFQMAQQAFKFLTHNGYDAIGFDHFALPHDPMAKAAKNGTLRRNFQGFTDDPGERLIGLGSSAISCFPELIAQNEKNNGRYRMMASSGQLTSGTGISRTNQDQLRGQVIEGILCNSSAKLSPCLLNQIGPRLAPFVDNGLVRLDGTMLTIAPEGLPYSRVVASLFDQYRETSAIRFSSAI